MAEYQLDVADEFGRKVDSIALGPTATATRGMLSALAGGITPQEQETLLRLMSQLFEVIPTTDEGAERVTRDILKSLGQQSTE
jgi:hypothetical protein